MTPDDERSRMDQYILEALNKVDAKIESMGKEITDLKLQIAGKPLPARPCEYLTRHLEEHNASRAFWYQRLGSALDALWKPVLALLILGAVLSGQIKVDILQRAQQPATPTQTKEVPK